MKIVYLFAMLLVAAVGAPSVLEEEFRSEFDAHDDDGDGLLN